MSKLCVGLGDRAYNIYIDSGVLEDAGRLISDIHEPCRVVILSDDNVWPLYGERLFNSLTREDFDVCTYVIKSGECSKSMRQLSELLEYMAEKGVRRSDILIAFGGGVVGDLGGFAAGVYMRGVAYVQIPTTLLAQVDSSVGGKTAVDLLHGKNLAGVFYQPILVLADTDLLRTLPDREFAGGMAEIIKYGAIRSKKLFEKIEDNPCRADICRIMPEIILECCDIKRQIVENDEFDTGERMLLNYGHTFGHAVEKIGNYEKYIHGEGVAMGMEFAAKYGEKTGISVAGLAKRIHNICAEFKLPDCEEVSPEDIIPYVSLDKKATGNVLRLVMVGDIGSSFVISVAQDEFGRVMKSL